LKKKILSMVILSIVLILAMFSAIPSVEAFDTAIHENKDNQAFNALANEGINFSPAAREKVNKANKGQDSVLSGTWKPEFHGDRKAGETHAEAFDRLRKYIKEEEDKAIALFNQCKTLDGLDALGRLLHAVQDFYAHSNYVELNATSQAAARAALDDPEQPIPADIQMCGWWGWPFTCNDAGGIFHYRDPLGYSHRDHNKDNAGTPEKPNPGYAAANAAAVSHTKDILREKWKKLTPAKQAEIAALPDIPFGTTQRMCDASYVTPHNYYDISLQYTGVLAVNLTIEEGLPYGITFQSIDPVPTYINTTFNATIVGWQFHDVMPIPYKEIKYQIYIGDEAATLPTAVSHDDAPIPGYVNFRGSVTEVDTNGTAYETSIGGDQLVRIGEPIGGCFIATAAYGTPMAEEIEVLREFRDQYLLTNPVGEALVDVYYKVSPPMAEFINEHPALKPVVRAGLKPAIAMSTVAVNTTPAEKTAIAGSLVLVSVALAVWATRRRGRGPEYT
jgi:hypothetical protein